MSGTAEDVAITKLQELNALLEKTEGHRVARVDRLYGGALSVHIGDMIASQRRERGRWIVTSWFGDWTVETAEGAINSLVDEDTHVVHAALNQCVGRRVVRAVATPPAMDLTVTLDSGVTLRLTRDKTHEGDMWTLSLPTAMTVSVDHSGGWSMQPDVPDATS